MILDGPLGWSIKIISFYIFFQSFTWENSFGKSLGFHSVSNYFSPFSLLWRFSYVVCYFVNIVNVTNQFVNIVESLCFVNITKMDFLEFSKLFKSAALSQNDYPYSLLLVCFNNPQLSKISFIHKPLNHSFIFERAISHK